MKSKLFMIFIVLASSYQVIAKEVLRHEEVLIIADNIAADAIDTEFQTGSVSVIHREDFDASSTSAADVLKKQVGVQVRSVGGLGTYSTISMRGSTSAQVNVYLDGVLVNEANGGAVDLSQFLLSNIDSIEIYRGNAPVQLGFSGIGGAINIKTRTPEENSPFGQLSHRVGTFETQKTSISLGNTVKPVNYFASFEVLKSDNDFKLTNINKTPDVLTDDFLDRRNNGEVKHINGFLHLNSELTNTSKITLISQYFDKQQNLPDQNNTEYNLANLETDFININLKYDYWFTSGLAASFKTSFSQKHILYDDRLGTLGVEENLEKTENEIFGLNSNLSFSFINHAVNVSFDAKKENYVINNVKTKVTSEYERDQFSIGLMDEWVNHTGQFLWSISGRFLNTQDGIELNDQNSAANSSTLHTGISFQYSPSLKYKINVSKDIRVPDLSEKYGDQGYTTGNPDLLNEEAVNLDVGFELKTNYLTITNMFFYRDLENAILTVFNSRGIGEAKNISQARIMGVELDSYYSISEIFSIVNRTTVQSSEEISSSRQFGEGRSLPGISTLDNYFSIIVKENNFKVTLEYEHKSGGYYDSSNHTAIKNLNQINIKTLMSFPKQDSSLEFAIDNLTGNEKEEFNRFRVEGVSFFAEYKVNF